MDSADVPEAHSTNTRWITRVVQLYQPDKWAGSQVKPRNHSRSFYCARSRTSCLGTDGRFRICGNISGAPHVHLLGGRGHRPNRLALPCGHDDVSLQTDGRPISAKTLAKRHGLPPRHLELLLQSLVRSGILKGHPRPARWLSTCARTP
jgi:hypothetical protein